jgi:hypothetical protein
MKDPTDNLATWLPLALFALVVCVALKLCRL